jgi:bla regulator protein BlaR1
MMATTFSTFWTTVAPGLANHLWQSTVFASAAALLTLPLRRNHARARYWLWMAASVKFLIPFSWLIAIGSHLSWLRPSAEVKTGLYVAIEQISRPFAGPVLAPISGGSPVVSSPWTQLFPDLLALVWLSGFFAVVLMWSARWRRISAAVRQSVPLTEGREVEALRRLERVVGLRQPVEIRLSHTTLEPGMFGWSRPVLLWPYGISGHLEDAHLATILIHELWHVRRRDNLAAALHMFVEAIFWFHPLVWWMGARLVEERERACDEQVLELGGRRQVYAESILKVCEFCVASPLACVSGVTGADLKRRMVHIMSEHVVRKLDFSRKLLLSVAGLATIAVPVLLGLMQATPSGAQSQAETSSAVPSFGLFSIRPSDTSSPRPNPLTGSTHGMRMMYGPDSFVADNVTLQALIQEAYGVQANQISGPSDLLNSGTFDVAAKVDPAAGFKFGLGPDRIQSQRMLQAALTDRTKLVLHHQTKVLPVYVLVVAEDGSKLQPSASEGPAFGMHRTQTITGNSEVVDNAQGVSLDVLAQQLSHHLGITVVDKTGLKGNYDFNLKWTENPSHLSDATETNAAPDDSVASDSSLFTALQQQLGLKLELQKQPMDILVIDHIEKPTEN